MDSLQDWVSKLRAYAVIATGGKAAGDEIVTRAINRLTDEHAKFCGEPGFNFRAFWYTLLEEELKEAGFGDLGLQRKAFVLMELEGLSAAETAHILGVGQSKIKQWCDGLCE